MRRWGWVLTLLCAVPGWAAPAPTPVAPIRVTAPEANAVVTGAVACALLWVGQGTLI